MGGIMCAVTSVTKPTPGDARPRAYVTAPLRGPGLDKLHALCDVVHEPWIDQQPLRIFDAEKLAVRVAEVEASVLIVESDACRGPVLELPLRVIGATRGDPTNVDLPAATAKGIPVLRCPGRNADAVAEMTIALLFAATRGIVAGDRDVRQHETFRGGTIPYQRYRAWQLAGRTAGVVGLGAVGRATRWRLEGLGMKVIAADPYHPEATHALDDLCAEAHVVTMHAVVTPETMGLMGRRQFEALPDGAVYVNTARAALHDMDALLWALRSGKLAAAGLDHFEGERLATDHPLIGMDNVALTPHIGGATYDVEANQASMVADDVERILEGGHPIHLANPEVLA
jgi:D-3-phosphoglycerate dehydrogenase / 2-oxoglutarate reductase